MTAIVSRRAALATSAQRRAGSARARGRVACEERRGKTRAALGQPRPSLADHRDHDRERGAARSATALGRRSGRARSPRSALQVRRLDRLVANLLELSRLEAGAADPELELWTVDGLVARALEAIGAGRRPRRRRRCPTDLPAGRGRRRRSSSARSSTCSRTRSSSRRRRDRSSPRARRRTARSSSASSTTGPASRPTSASAIFEPFVRGASGDGERGSGLGLAIARGFVESERRPALGRVGAGRRHDVRRSRCPPSRCPRRCRHERRTRARRRRRAADPARAADQAPRRRLRRRDGGDGAGGAR